MGRIKNPVRFTTCFSLAPTALTRLGVLDPTLNADTKLFIDPMLLAKSRHREMKQAAKDFRDYFATLAKLLAVTKKPGDVAWRSAEGRLRFSEVMGTCLGYGAGTIAGSGFGPALRSQLLHTAKEIVDLGIRDPDLFPALALLDADVGPDRISDMTTNVILPQLAAFTERIAARLGIKTKRYSIKGRRYALPVNPVVRRTPVFLVPRDVLRPLPVAADWDAVAVVAAHNSALRERVNQRISAIWQVQAERNKEDLRAQALTSKESFDLLLELIHGAKAKPYDIEADPQGLLAWRERLGIAKEHPILLSLPSSKERRLDDVEGVVARIAEQFKVLVERNGLWKDLWNGAKRRPEKAAQRLFFAVADSYCKANGLDLAPETDAGWGPVDFKMSAGAEAKVLVEIKLSSNRKLVDGYTKQLEAYKSAEQTLKALYLVIDVGLMGKKDEKLVRLRNREVRQGLTPSNLLFVDGSKKRSASKQ